MGVAVNGELKVTLAMPFTLPATPAYIGLICVPELRGFVRPGEEIMPFTPAVEGDTSQLLCGASGAGVPARRG
jgi:hypothetical protein